MLCLLNLTMMDKLIKMVMENKKGSAIFLHCFGTKGYTGGCVAVSRENMNL